MSWEKCYIIKDSGKGCSVQGICGTQLHEEVLGENVDNAQRQEFSVQKIKICISEDISAETRTEHVYWDNFHTETMGSVVQLPNLWTI